LDDLLMFQVPVQCKVHERRIGLLLKVCQAAVLLGVVFQIYVQGSWTHRETPYGRVNAWLEHVNGQVAENAHGNFLKADPPSYCNGKSQFAVDSFWILDYPQCMWWHIFELVTKSTNGLAVATSSMQIRETAWLKGGEADERNVASCQSRNGTLETHGMQRTCVSKRTVYPVGVEDLLMVFEHFYKPLNLESRIDGFSGNSNVPDGKKGSVDTTLLDYQGKEVETIKSGQHIKKTLREWLKIGGIASLDGENSVWTDYRARHRVPTFRTTGCVIDFTVVYDNRDRESKKPEYHNEKVLATLHVKAHPEMMYGVPKIDYAVPSQKDAATGVETYDRIIKWNLAVNFRFRCEGWIYIMDWAKVFNQLIASAVMLRLAKAMAIKCALVCHPRAKMLRNATTSTFDVSARLGTIGLKAALAALEFERLGPDKTDQVKLATLVSVYGKIRDMTFQQAYAAAHLVIALARKRVKKTKQFSIRELRSQAGGIRKFMMSSLSSVRLEESAATALDFDRLLHIQEGQGVIPWKRFLEVAEVEAESLMAQTSDEERSECLLAYEQQQQQQVFRETITEEAPPSMENRLEVLERSFSELKVDLEKQFACKYHELAISVQDMQAKVEGTLKNECNVVQHQQQPLAKTAVETGLKAADMQLEWSLKAKSELKVYLDEQVARQFRNLETAMLDVQASFQAVFKSEHDTIKAELRVYLDEQVARQFRKLDNTMVDIQASFQAMFKSEHDVVQKNVKEMRQMGVRCSEIIDRHVEATSKLTTLMERGKDKIEQRPAKGDTKTKVADARRRTQQPLAGSSDHPSTSTIPMPHLAEDKHSLMQQSCRYDI